MSRFETDWPVPADHPAFAGHFPGQPILPGVVLIDAALRAVREHQPGVARWSIAQAKFLRPVRPGDALRLVLNELAGGAYSFSFERDGQAVASGQLRPSAP